MTGQDGHVAEGRSTAAVTAVAVLVAGTLLSAVGFAALGSDTASAETVLRADSAGAVLVLPDGTRREAVAGEQIPNGATVALPGPGRAVLVTRDRETWLAQESRVRVVDGVRQELAAGTAFVDSADAPGLALDTPVGVVTVRRGALVRVDTGTLPRVGVLRTDGDRDADGAEVRASGRRTATFVPAYRQVLVPRGGLPGSVDPLRLVPGDAVEARLAEDLVAAERYLEDLDETLESSPAQAAAVRTALADVAPAALTPGDGGVSFLVASAADGPLPERLAEVRALRELGGSWGPVAALVGATVEEVGARLDALLAPMAVALPEVAGADGLTDVLGLGLPAAAPGDPVAGPQAPGASDGDQPDGGSPGTPAPDRPSPAPSPSPSPGPLEPVTDAVEDVVDAVLDLVAPSPSPSGSTAPAPAPLLDVEVAVPPLLR